MGAVASPSGPQLVVKVADFGLARVQDTARTMTGGIGTSQYTAPEVLRSERYDTKADVFSGAALMASSWGKFRVPSWDVQCWSVGFWWRWCLVGDACRVDAFDFTAVCRTGAGVMTAVFLVLTLEGLPAASG
eukprot:2968801-Rhodomonas_salina.1